MTEYKQKLKILIAPDKFKNSLSSICFCNIVSKILKKKLPHAEIIKLPLADGGDGTVAVLNHYLAAKTIETSVYDPLFRKIKASYLYNAVKQTAYIEMAVASGLHLLKKEERNPMHTTSFGTGELIKHALEQGANQIIVGIGGSATNDAGIGMAKALGYQFFDKSGYELRGVGSDLQKLHSISTSKVHPKISTATFTIAYDVANPLFGKEGAATIYAQQKGANSKTIRELDKGLRNFKHVMQYIFNQDVSTVNGAGAAGGLGAGAIIFLNAQLQSGIELLKDLAAFQHHSKNTDWIISGEGTLDTQTFKGKVIQGVINEITTQKLALFCGTTTLSKDVLRQLNIDYVDCITNYANSQEEAIQNAKLYLQKIALQFASSIK